MQRQFGDIASIFIHGTYPNYAKALNDTQNLVIDPNDDPSGFKRKAVERKIQTLIDKEQKVNDDKVKVFAVIWGQLATDSQNKVSATDKWTEVNDSSDALELLVRVKNTHLTSGKLDEEENEYEARNSYNKLYMQQSETTGDFKKRFDAAIKVMVSVKQDIPSQPAQARDFLGKLDRARYVNMLTVYQNGMLAKASTLEEAYHLASNFVVATPSGHSSTIVAVATRKGGPGRGHGRGRSNNGRGNRGGRGRVGPSKEHPCSGCGADDHWINDCPKAVSEAVEEETGGNKNKNKKTILFTNILPNDILDNEDLHENMQYCPETTHIHHQIIASSQQLHKKGLVYLDTCAGVSIWKSKYQLSNIRQTDATISVAGVNAGAEPIYINVVGDHEDFGEVYYLVKTLVISCRTHNYHTNVSN